MQAGAGSAERMDPATRTLQLAREEVLYSQEWEDLNKELFSQIQRLEYLEGRGRQRPFATLSNREKLVTVGKATKALEKTRAYGELERKVSNSVEHHFSPVGPYPATGPSRSAESLQTPRSAAGSDTPMRNISEACSHLLLEWPHLKCHLKNCFNHPFPPGLRISAWKVILQHSSVKKEFLANSAKRGFQELQVTPEEKRIAHRCEVLLSSNPVFHDMADSASILRAMKNVILFWSLKAGTGNMITDTDLLVCIPFLYVWREELSRTNSETGIGKGQNWSVVAEIAEQYISFMEMLPLTMHSVISDHTLEAMNKFSLQVEQLLNSEDQKLYRALQKLLRSPTRTRFGISQEELPFHKRLRNIIHPHVQKMLVGDVSMEVLCYIWDQCFIGIDSGPDYQCLPYFITVWLILLRENLIACHSVKSAEVILSTNSSSLTVPQFQEEIEKRFLEKLSSQLRIVPVKLGERSRLQHQGSKPVASESTALRPTERRELEPATGELTSGSHPPEDPEKEHLRRRVAELQMQLELEQMRMKLEQKNFSDTLSKETELHKRRMESLIGEVEAMKKEVSESVLKSQSQDPACSVGVSAEPTNITLLSPLSGNTRCVLPLASSHFVPDPFTVAGNPPAQTQAGSLRPYSPSHLTESDVQDIWLKILRRFTDAAYMVCHGTDEERRHELLQRN